MSPILALALSLALVVLTSVLGLVARARTGRVSRADPASISPESLGLAGGFGPRATLVQFSTEFCAPCRATARLLDRVAAESDGVAHVEIDLTRDPALARRFQVLQTPTTLIVDAEGVARARIGGAPQPGALRDRLHRLLEETHVAAS